MKEVFVVLEDEAQKVVEDFQESWKNLKSVLEENLAPNLELKKVVGRKSGRLTIALVEREDEGTYTIVKEYNLSLSGEEQEEDVEAFLDVLKTGELGTFKHARVEKNPPGVPDPPQPPR